MKQPFWTQKPLAFRSDDSDNRAMDNNNTEAVLTSLEKLYLEGKFDQARELFLTSKDSLPEGPFYYNLGTLYAKEGDFVAARYNLEKAISKKFINTMVFNNLKAVKQELNVLDLGQSSSFYDRTVNASLLIPTEAYLSITFILVLGLMIAKKMKFVRSLALSIVLFVLFLVPFAYSFFYLKTIDYAIVLKDAEIYEGPSKIYVNTGIVPGGSKIIIGKLNNGRYLIKHPLNLSGWIDKNDLGFLH